MCLSRRVGVSVTLCLSMPWPTFQNSPMNGNCSTSHRKLTVGVHVPPLLSSDVSTKLFFKNQLRASLVAQWLRICLLMQGTRVRALVWEDPTCRGAAKPVSHNYWACASGACALQREATIVRGPRTAMKSGPRSPQLEEALAQKRRPNTAKNK